MLGLTLLQHYVFSKRAGSLIKTVALISIFGVALGLFALVLVMSVMNGFSHSIERRLLAVEPHLVVSLPGAKSETDLKGSEAGKWLYAQPQLRVDFFEEQDVILRSVEGHVDAGELRGLEPSALNYILKRAQDVRQKPQFHETLQSLELKPGEVLLGAELAQNMKVYEGDTLTLVSPEALLLPSGEVPPFEKVKIAGLVSTEFADIDQRLIFYNRTPGLAKLRGSSQFHVGLEVRTPDYRQLSRYQEELRKRGAIVKTWEERNSSLFYALKLERIMVGVLNSMSALITGFSLIAFMALLITHKRKEIGLLMALGLSKSQTRRVFLSLGLILSSVGIFLGIFFGVAAAVLVDKYSYGILPEFYYDRSIPADVSTYQVLTVLLVALAFCIFGCWLAIKRNILDSPSEALRTKQVI